MSKSFKNANSNTPKKVVEKEHVALKNNPLSIIVPLHNQVTHVQFLEESLKRIKPENLSKIELVLMNTTVDQQVINAVAESATLSALKAQNILKYSADENGQSVVKAITSGIEKASNEFVFIFDMNHINAAFNLNDLFVGSKDLSKAVYMTNFHAKNKKSSDSPSLFLGNKEVFGYIFANIVDSSNYKKEVVHQLKQMDVEIKKINVSQSNPFNPNKFNLANILLKPVLNKLNWFFVVPIKDFISKKQIPSISPKPKESSLFRLFFALVAVLSFIIMPMLAYHTGNSGDEDYWQYPQAEKIYKYYTTFGKDKSYLNEGNQELEGMKHYGMSFDTFTVFFNKIFNIEDVMESRHAMNALVGWLAMFFCALLAYRLANWRAALLTFILIFFSPRFLGHSFNNPKDIPFAMAYIFAIYYMVRFFQQFPKPTKKTMFLLALGIGLSVSVRVGGFILIAYLAVFGAMYMFYANKIKYLFSDDNVKRIKKLALYSIVISIVGYFIGVVLWPYAIDAPLSNPKKSLSEMTNFYVSLRQIYEGATIWSDKVPWYYTIKYMMITIPISVIVGALLFLGLYKKKGLDNFWAFVLLFAFGFPVFYIAFKHSNVYGGWRHAIFAYPTLVVVAGLGFDRLFHVLKKSYLKIIGVVILILFTAHPIMHVFKNHPYEYVYFNELAGGVKGAYGQYELDYYFHSLREASQWVKDDAKKDPNFVGKKVKVGAWLTSPINYYMRKDTANFQVVFVRYYERGNFDWDYAIFANTGVSPDQLKNKTWPPKNTVHTITVDGMPICAILKRTNKDDLLASQFKAKADNPSDSMNVRIDNMKQAEMLYKKVLNDDPNNENVLFSLTEMFMSRGSLDSANMYADLLLKVYPSYENGLNLKGWIGLQRFEVTKNAALLEDSRLAFEKIIKVNYKYVYGYYGLARTYILLNDVDRAIQALEEALKVNPGFQQAAELLNQLKNYSAQQGGM